MRSVKVQIRTRLKRFMPMKLKRARQKSYSPPDELRTRIMRSNKSHGNVSTELTLMRLFRFSGISGWRRGIEIAGRPDFVFKHQRLAVFIDGCYWHGCKCRRLPKKNRLYWQQKFISNQTRDRRVTRDLRNQGWIVIRIWEHELKKRPEHVLKRMLLALTKNKLGGMYGNQKISQKSKYCE